MDFMVQIILTYAVGIGFIIFILIWGWIYRAEQDSLERRARRRDRANLEEIAKDLRRRY